MNLNLEKIKLLPKDIEVSILPHDNPDVDAILSSVLLAKLFNFLGYKNKIIILDKKISKDTLYICNLSGINPKDFMVSSITQDNKVVLVDHYESKHTSKVIGCIDHHPTKTKPDYDIYEYREACSTANIIYSFMLEVNMPITKEIVIMLAYAMLVDTTGFVSSKTVDKEAKMLPILLEKFGIDYAKIKHESMLYTDIYNMEMGDIINNGAKVYDYKIVSVKSSYLQLQKTIDKKTLFDILLYIKNELEKTKEFSLWVYIIYSIENNETICYYLKPDCEIVEKRFEGVLSRGNDIMPEIEKMYN